MVKRRKVYGHTYTDTHTQTDTDRQTDRDRGIDLTRRLPTKRGHNMVLEKPGRGVGPGVGR